MLAAINLDDDTLTQTREIDNEISDWRLTAEMQVALRAKLPQTNPQFDLLRGQAFPQFSCRWISH